MVVPSFHFISAAQNLKSTLTLVGALVLILVSIHISFRPRIRAKSSFADILTKSSPQSCGHEIADTDFSSTGIRCRIQAAQSYAREAFKSQSSSPEQAVDEYRRRYHRDPPSGFKEWAQFALDHDSQVIDDYDQIERDLEPFRAPEARRAFQVLNGQLENWPHTRRLIVQDGAMNASGWYMYDAHWKTLIQPFVHALPNQSLFYMSTIDEPRVLAKSEHQPDKVEFTESIGQSVERLVKDSCTQTPRELSSRLGHEKDICQFPDPGKLHGMIVSPSTFSYTYSLVPLLSFGRMSAFRDILIPCPCYFGHPLLEENPIPFRDKKPQVYWRGSSTGGQSLPFNWMYGHRQRFVAFVQTLQNAANVLDAGRYFGAKVNDLDQNKIRLLKDVFDVRMGAYIQCEHDGDRKACRDMERTLGPGDFEPEDTSRRYRYLFDLDGNSMSTRFYRLLSAQAVVLKQTWFQEWHDDRLIPWAHYIPVTMSMEELPALMSFLINDTEGEKLSEDIAQAGYSWSRKVLREIDMSIYTYRLLLELAALYGPVDPLEPGFQAATERIV